MGHYNPYSPTNGPPPQPPYASNAYASRPSSSAAMNVPPPLTSSQSPRLGPPPSPTNGLHHPSRSNYSPREQSKSTYYDPTTDQREAPPSWGQSSYANRSPVQREQPVYYNAHADNIKARSSHHSPKAAYFSNHSPTFPNLHAHPPSSHESSTYSMNGSIKPLSPRLAPSQSSVSHIVNGNSERLSSTEKSLSDSRPKPKEEPRSSRADPMSFSNILSSTSTELPKPVVKSTPPPAPPVLPKPAQQVEKPVNGDSAQLNPPLLPATTSTRRLAKKSPTVKEEAPLKQLPRDTSKPKAPRSSNARKSAAAIEKENQKVQLALADIEAMVHSDLEAPGWEVHKDTYGQSKGKRVRSLEDTENEKRKRRRKNAIGGASATLGQNVFAGREAFRIRHENEVMHEVQRKEVYEEKERKKDMQRKRRREKTIANETQKQKEALEKANQAADAPEREKFLKEAQKAERKTKSAKRALDHGEVQEELGEVPPLALNLEGGTMSTFHSVNGASPEPPQKRQKTGAARPKKSKEKKQAEKDAAEAAFAALEREGELVPLAPKERNETPRDTPVAQEKKGRGKKAAPPKESSPAPPTTNYVSKGYNQMYEQIMRDIARSAHKTYRHKLVQEDTKMQNLKKTVTLASKEAKRYQMKTNKSMKEFQARAKRISKEMGTFWKRNEKIEKEKQREAKKEEVEQQRRMETEREAARQRRKLDFLISQTEIFSHFVNKNLKPSQSKENGGDGVATAEDASSGFKSKLNVNLAAASGGPSTNFDDLDFDDEDDTARRNAAAASAHAALKKQQDQAKEFASGDMQQQMDDSGLNFQNPTSLVSMDIPQPKMLTCQLKEYQLKGFNWLCDLWDKSINGILADEMGLGKTVQSISVMAYLAETHNIWGPFLVVAPASTLHNWQQEIARFVPKLKIVPYWGSAKDRKILRKFWARTDLSYKRDSDCHVVITSYQLVVQDAQYFQKMKWQYMILDEAQAIKSSSSSRWKSLLKFQSRNRLLLTGTPIQNNMQELWALLHFIMPSLFDSHDEFSEWFSKDIESHAQSNTKLDEEQLKRLHMILKPFMLRRIKKHVQKELGDKVEIDLFCDLAYRQKAYYTNLRNKISLMDLIEKAGVGEEADAQTLMNLVVQFRKVCNHPDLFERAQTTSPFAFSYFAETASFVREGREVDLAYSVKNVIDYDLPRLLCSPEGRMDMAGPANSKAGFRDHCLYHMMNIWNPEFVKQSSEDDGAFSSLKLTNTTASEACEAARNDAFARAVKLSKEPSYLGRLTAIYEDTVDEDFTPSHSMLNIVDRSDRRPLAEVTKEGYMKSLLNVAADAFSASGLGTIEPGAAAAASAPPIQVACSDQNSEIERQNILFNAPMRKALYGLSLKDERALLEADIDPQCFPVHDLLPKPISQRARYTDIRVPSMRRFVTDCGKLHKLDQLLRELREGGHRVLLYFQMTKMIDLMEEYLTYRNYKYCRLDGSTSIENRRDVVQDFQTNPEIFVFLLSTRAGGLGINLTSADTVIFYDSDWNPTIDSQAMDRAHRLGQTKQVTVYRLITRSTIEERIRKRALQKEEVQRVVITGESKGGVDFNTRSKDTKTKDMVMWLADDDEEAELIEKKEQEMAEKQEDSRKGGRKKAAAAGGGKRGKEVSMDDMYHEGEGHFDDGSAKPSGAATPMDSDAPGPAPPKRGPRGGRGSKKAKTVKQRLAIIDGSADV